MNGDERLMELEIRYAHLEHLVEQLNELVRSQADELARLHMAMKQLHGRLESLGEESPPNEKPPHY
jgi:SlyX protein